MKKVNKTRNHAEADSTGLLSAPEDSAEQIATAQFDPVTILETIDLKGIANFAVLKAELLVAEHEIFDGVAPDAFVKNRNALIALLGRTGKAGLQTGLLLMGIKADLKAENHWVRYGNPIAKAMGLKSISALNHIIRRTEGPAKLPKKILSAVIELGLEPIDGRNKQLIDKLPRHFEGTGGQARDLVRAEQDRVTEAKREARKKSAEKRAKKEVIGAHSQEPTDRQWGEKLRDCPEGERLALMGTIITKLNSEIETYLPGHKVQLVPVTGGAGERELNSSGSLTARVTVGAGPVQLRVAAPRMLEAPHPVTSSEFGTLLPSLQTATLCNGDCRTCEHAQSGEGLDTDPACDFRELKEISTARTGASTISAPCVQSVIFRPWNLYTLTSRELPPTIFRVPPEMEPLEDSIWMKVMLEHIEVFRRAGRHVLAFTTEKFDALVDLNSRILARYGSWPWMIWPGLAIRRQHDIGKIAKLAAIRPEMKWVTFELWNGDPHDKARILDDVGLAAMFHRSGIKWVVAGGAQPQDDLSEIEQDDLVYFIRQAKAAKCLVFVSGLIPRTVDKVNAPQLNKPLENLRMDDLRQLPPFAPGRSPEFRGFAPRFVPCKVYPLTGLPMNTAR